ncbi:cyclic pyranopterin monophosphate synthase MoaC [Hominiventricola aquisgranensis]|uniref:Cyclic pyranopterin monophosphate synthase MoaC n=1 Tax=Hominiventricola aquisgranensis TaxID=3133164 RepID=A0ABV1I4C8_9FIRM
MGEFTHFNQHGDAIMVDISKKAETAREAIAEGRISMNQECFDQLKAGSPPPPGTSQCYSWKIL